MGSDAYFHQEQNGRVTVIESGGTLQVKSGATLLIDAGATVSGTPGNLARAVINKTGSTIAVDKLVAIVGLDATSGKPQIVLADADVAAHDDVWVTTAAILNNAEGVVYQSATSAANLNTNSASAAGDPVYLSTTAGGFAHTAPTGATARVQIVGFVAVKSATVGQIIWQIGAVQKFGSNELQAQTLDGTQAANVANAPVIGGLVIVFPVTATALTGDVDIVSTHKVRVFSVEAIAAGAGGAGDTITVKNGATAITDALDLNVADKVVVRAATLDAAAWDIAAGGTLRVSGASGVNAQVRILAYRVA